MNLCVYVCVCLRGSHGWSLPVMQGALTQLIQYYHSFHKILNQPTFRSLAVRSELINLHHLMVEVKKHKPNF